MYFPPLTLTILSLTTLRCLDFGIWNAGETWCLPFSEVSICTCILGSWKTFVGILEYCSCTNICCLSTCHSLWCIMNSKQSRANLMLVKTVPWSCLFRLHFKYALRQMVSLSTGFMIWLQNLNGRTKIAYQVSGTFSKQGQSSFKAALKREVLFCTSFTLLNQISCLGEGQKFAVLDRCHWPLAFSLNWERESGSVSSWFIGATLGNLSILYLELADCKTSCFSRKVMILL